MIHADRYRLRERRERLKLTRARLASRLGLSIGAVQSAEHGKASRYTTRRIRIELIREELKRRELERENRRIERQRSLWADIPDCEAAHELRHRMLERAWSLLDAGETEKADELLYFVPEAEARALLDQFFGDQ